MTMSYAAIPLTTLRTEDKELGPAHKLQMFRRDTQSCTAVADFALRNQPTSEGEVSYFFTSAGFYIQGSA